MILEWQKVGPENQKNQKSGSAETPDCEIQSRAGAKEGGGGEVNLPPRLGGLGGSEDRK
jgi:hypothetical protein